MLFFSFYKDESWFAILKTKLLAGNDHVIDIFTSEDMENISLCIFQYLTVNYIIINIIYHTQLYCCSLSSPKAY